MKTDYKAILENLKLELPEATIYPAGQVERNLIGVFVSNPEKKLSWLIYNMRDLTGFGEENIWVIEEWNTPHADQTEWKTLNGCIAGIKAIHIDTK